MEDSVGFENLVEEIWDKIDVIDSRLIFGSILTCGGTTTEKYLNVDNIFVPDVLRELNLEFGSYSMNWRVQNPDIKNRVFFACSNNYGTTHLDYGGFQNRICFEDNRDIGKPFYNKVCTNENAQFWKQLYILDDLKFGKLILIKPNNNDNEHDLYLFDYPDTVVKLKVNLDDYLLLLKKTLGLYNWQEYLTETSYSLDGAIPDSFHKAMNTLFPDEDLSMFRSAPVLEDSIFNRYIDSKNKKDYRRLFIETMNKLKSNSNIEFLYYEDTVGYLYDKTPYTAHYGVTEAVLRKIKRDYGREISEQMLAFYYQMNGCKVSWRYKLTENDHYIQGNINLLNLEEVMGGKWKESYLQWSSPNLFKDEGSVYYFNEEEAIDNPEMAELMLHARLLEDKGEMQDYFIDFIEGEEEPAIYKIVRTSFYKMNISFSTFIQARIQFAGISGWEYRFINHPDFSHELINKTFNEFKEQVNLIITDADFSILE
ncbi:MAG: hypothetical protein N4A72_08915 [Bacteroidales bacterium]|jgi:hypothetical protein|nr:hypothetical protein [Bacteroidales bacterium]